MILQIDDNRVSTDSHSPAKNADSPPTRTHSGKRDEVGREHPHDRRGRHCRPFGIRKRFVFLAAVLLVSLVHFNLQWQQSSQPLRTIFSDLSHVTTLDTLLLTPRVLAAAQGKLTHENQATMLSI